MRNIAVIILMALFVFSFAFPWFENLLGKIPTVLVQDGLTDYLFKVALLNWSGIMSSNMVGGRMSFLIGPSVRVRSEPYSGFLDLFLSGGLSHSLGWVASRILPAADHMRVRDQVSEPFVQELTKQTLEECVRSFGRVVILIDDLDALPSEKFHELLRFVRPLSKVGGVRGVLATPLFFHLRAEKCRVWRCPFYHAGKYCCGQSKIIP